MTEWREVAGEEGRYEVSDDGRVRSVMKGSPHELKPWGRPPKGYLTVKFGHAGKSLSVHRLVLEAFRGPCPPGHEALHADDNHMNNHLSNLRWGTRSENQIDRVRNGLSHNANKTHCKRGHRFNRENTYIKRGGGRQCRVCLKDAARMKRKVGVR